MRQDVKGDRLTAPTRSGDPKQSVDEECYAQNRYNLPRIGKLYLKNAVAIKFHLNSNLNLQPKTYERSESRALASV